MKFVVLLLVLMMVLSCQPGPPIETPDVFYQYSIWDAFVNRIFDGTLTSQELKNNGDIALGCYNGLNGELVMVDGHLVQITADGVVHETEGDEEICFANATWFDADRSIELNEPITYASLRDLLDERIPSQNQFYAFRIPGTFRMMKCGSIQKQEKPYDKGLDELIPERPIFIKDDVEGVLVGFYCPQFMAHINVPGYHLHFLSNDKTYGGHVIDFEASRLTVQLDLINGYHFDLPETEAYFNASFDKSFQYGKK